METWDIYDKNRIKIGNCVRGDSFAPDTYHIVVDIWVLNGDGEFLVTRRAPEKNYAGFWENSAGSILEGESSIEGASRELYEETGIATLEDELILIHERMEETAHWDSYFVYKENKPIVTLQAGETDDYRWVTLKELDQMAEQGILAGPVIKRYKLNREGLIHYLKERITGAYGE